MDQSLKEFESEVAVRLEDAPCDERSFLGLARKAVAIYTRHPGQGEALAQRMTSVWFSSSDTWGEGKSETIGQLFADLDVPPYQVQGGEAGASAKWKTIQQLVGEEERSGDSSPDR